MYNEFPENPAQIVQGSAFRLERKEWRDFLSGRGYRAGVDFPVAKHWKEVLDAYPQSKVILATRDPTKWYQSVKNTLYQWKVLSQDPMFVQFGRAIGSWKTMEYILEILEDIYAVIENGEEASVQYFKEWANDVKSHVQEENLLVFDVREGWGPLCKFLGLPQPDQAFPRVNDTAVMLRDLNRARIVTKTMWIIAFMLLYTGGCLLTMAVWNIITS